MDSVSIAVRCHEHRQRAGSLASSLVGPERTARDMECPVCGAAPPVDIFGVAYDCNGQTSADGERHPWTRPERRDVTSTTLLGHDDYAPLSLRHEWSRAARAAASGESHVADPSQGQKHEPEGDR